MPSNSIEKPRRNSLGGRPGSVSRSSSAERVQRKRKGHSPLALSEEDDADKDESHSGPNTPVRTKRRRRNESPDHHDQDPNDSDQTFDSPPRSITRPRQQLSANRPSTTNSLDAIQIRCPPWRETSRHVMLLQNNEPHLIRSLLF